MEGMGGGVPLGSAIVAVAPTAIVTIAFVAAMQWAMSLAAAIVAVAVVIIVAVGGCHLRHLRVDLVVGNRAVKREGG